METLKTLRKVGNSLGVIIPNHILKEAGFKEKSKVKIRSENGVIYIEPAQGREQKILKAAAKYVKKYREDFAELAK